MRGDGRRYQFPQRACLNGGGKNLAEICSREQPRGQNKVRVYMDRRITRQGAVMNSCRARDECNYHDVLRARLHISVLIVNLCVRRRKDRGDPGGGGGGLSVMSFTNAN